MRPMHFMLVVFAAVALPDFAFAEKLRLLWDGVPESTYYELQTAADPKFKTELQKSVLHSVSKVIELPAIPRYTRVRGIFANRTASSWSFVTLKRWAAPKVPETIRIAKKEAGEHEIRWSPPAGERAEDLTYRVRILAGNGVALYDSLVKSPRIIAPKLPGGTYQLTVEPVGVPSLGTWHAEGEGLASARIDADDL